MARLFSVVFLMKTIFPIVTANRYYFDYSDCETQCSGSYCIMYDVTPTSFQTSCTELEQQCRDSASPESVCLHPDSPPVGGESIWPVYRDSHPEPSPLPVPTTMKLKVAAKISSTVNIVFLLTFLYSALRRLFRRRNYEPLPNPIDPTHPYQPTNVSV